MIKTKKRYISYKCINNMYHIQLDGEVLNKTLINISKYIPHIIKNIINSIPDKLNKQYIICPYYKKYYDYQIGITETVKLDELNTDAIHRGVNEECGLSNLIWNKTFTLDSNVNWFGVIINNINTNNFNPNQHINLNTDTKNKVAMILHDNPYKLLQTYTNIQIGDINSDGISGIGLISIEDCKKIINRSY